LEVFSEAVDGCGYACRDDGLHLSVCGACAFCAVSERFRVVLPFFHVGVGAFIVFLGPDRTCQSLYGPVQLWVFGFEEGRAEGDVFVFFHVLGYVMVPRGYAILADEGGCFVVVFGELLLR
jgi:hypothetical protein